MSRLFKILVMIAVLFFGILLGTRLHNGSRFTVFDEQKKLLEVMSLISSRYVDEVSSDSLAEKGIQAMVESLDPHTAYLSPQKVSYSRAEFKGNFEGIGIEFDILSDTLVVVNPLAGGPSEAAGIMAGDRIVAIDSGSAIGLSSEDVVAALRGETGSSVQLEVFRPFSGKVFSVDVVRNRIPTYSVDAAFLLDDSTGYIRLSRFVSTTSAEFDQALARLLAEGMHGLVVDMRGNPGGYLDQAAGVADEFLPGDSLVVYTKSRRGGPDDIRFRATEAGDYEDGPVIVVVDRGSASATEILAGALQDNGRALVVGEQTYGKGLVQRQFDFEDGSALRLTIARYYTPSGRQIQRSYVAGEEGREAYFQNGDGYRDLERRFFFEEGDDLLVDTGVRDARVYRSPDRGAFDEKIGSTGGILPDYWVFDKAPGALYSRLQDEGVFQLAALYVLDDPSSAVRGYRDDLDGFLGSYTERDLVEHHILEVCRMRGIDVDNEQFSVQSGRMFIAVKSILARQLYGISGQIRFLVERGDNVLNVARRLLDEQR
ncbi:S41 family peptidase [Prosthecochloris sp. CIB 2401]|uniref:S41 family peptidase n=1 Tax=Prosthecochloris sp. CIB 2401 TaxID=1868325 RepID=UPI00080AAB23|nr:S41 family peptidase [Prosthecochloris sp. CIB 2401]ANT64846.1 Carboxy-terminal processing protease CtpB precursor [Prosthecochloris sp. CIB 2401]